MKKLKTILLVTSILIVSLVLTSVALANTRELTTEEKLQPLYEEKATLEAWRYWEGLQLEKRKDLVRDTELVIEQINKTIQENQDTIDNILGSPLSTASSGGGATDSQCCWKEDVGDDYNEKLRGWCDVSGNDIDFVKTMFAENGALNPVAVNWNKNGSFDKGMCQLNSAYHLDYINGEDFKDWRKQQYYCRDVYVDAVERGVITTRFYGYNVRNQRATSGGLICNK